MSTPTKHDDLPPEAFGVELDPLPPRAREDAGAKADRVIHGYETEEREPAEEPAWLAKGVTAPPSLPPDAAALVEACEARAAKATEGPIDVHRFDNEGGSISWQLQQQVRPRSAALVLCEFDDCENHRARFDAEFYANARTDIPSLCALVRAQQGEIGRVKAAGMREIKVALFAESSAIRERDEALAEIERLKVRLAKLGLGGSLEEMTRWRDEALKEIDELTKAELERLGRVCASLRQERDSWQNLAETNADMARGAFATVERMKPVVEAAIDYYLGGDRGELKAAVAAYRGEAGDRVPSDLRGLAAREAQR